MNALNISMLAGGFYTCTPRWSQVDEQAYAFSRLYFPRRGQASVDLRGKRTIIRPGSVYLIPGRQALSCECGHRLELEWLHFLPDHPEVDDALCGIGEIVRWPAERWRFWRPVYRRMNDLFAAPSYSLRQQALAMIAYYLSELVSGCMDRRPRPLPRDVLDRLEPALQFMSQRCTSNPPLETIAKVVSLSPSRFHYLFKKAFDATPHAYVLRHRMQLARSYLQQSQLSVTQIAEQTGYSDVFYFSRAFKRYFQLSPTAYRNQMTLDSP